MVKVLMIFLSIILFTTSIKAVDFNKDSIPDLVFKSDEGYLKTWEIGSSYTKTELWLANLGSANWKVFTEVGDLDKDANPDILIQDKTTGYMKAIKMSAFTKQDIKWVANPDGAEWRVKSIVDIDGNGYPDIILQNSTNNYIKAYKLGANFSATAQWIGNPGIGWDIEGISDVDGDGIADIVMQDPSTGYIKAFKMNSDFSKIDKWISNPGGVEWDIKDGISDIDGDGIADIVIQSTTTGYIKALKLASDFKATSKWIGNPSGVDWEVKSVSDLDGDGVKDIVLQNISNGYVKAYQVNSSFSATSKWIGNPGGSGWIVVKVEDMDNDGQSDVVLQDTSNGYVKAYDIDTTFKGTSTWIGNAGSSWDINIDGDEESMVSEKTISISTDDHGDSISASTVIELNSTTSGSIEEGGDSDYFKLVVLEKGTITISSQSSIDTYGYLYDSNGLSIAENDDSGDELNFNIIKTLNAGTYYVRVKAFSSTTTGTYSLETSFVISPLIVETDINTNVATVSHNKSSIPMLGILISYNDISISSSATVWSSKVFGKSEGELNHYYQEASNSQFEFTKALENDGVVNDGIVSVSLNRNHPNISIDNTSLYAWKVHQDLRDVLTSLDSKIDFSNYDNDANGYITPDELLLTFVMAGYEDSYEGVHVQYGTWGHQSCVTLDIAPTIDGVSLMNCNGGGNYAIFGERHDMNNPHDATIGIIAHELGHSAFSLPDLYNTSASTGGIGNFGLMGGGSWGISSFQDEAGNTPVHFSAWSKVYMGWVTPIEGDGSESLHETSSLNYNVIKVSINDDEYYLLENRNNSGYDRGLFGLNGDFNGGMALWHINKKKLTDSHFTNNTVNSTTSDKGVDLVEASNATIDTVSLSPGDEKALFYSPNISSFEGIISNVSERGSTMTLNID